MDNKGRITFQSKKKAPLYPQTGNKAIASLASSVNRRRLAREAKLALQKDVDELKKKLRYEENVHRALERAFSRPLGALPRLPPYLPQHTLELLAEVAVLEEEVLRLEEQITNFRKGLHEEAVHVHVKSQKNSKDVEVPQHGMSTRKHKHQHSRSRSQTDADTISALPSPVLSKTHSSIRLKPSAPVQTNGKGALTEQISRRDIDLSKENRPCSNPMKLTMFVDSKLAPRNSVKVSPLNPMKSESTILQLCRLVDQAQEISSSSSSDDRGLETEPTANKVSEDILKCLSAIFLRLSKSRGKTMNSDSYSCSLANGFSENHEMDFRDPYCISSEFRKRDIGPYRHLCAIEASSIDLKRVTIASFLIRRLKLLLDKLVSVKVENLNHQQKLAFWINIYNSCMMNAFLDHGIPDSEEMVVALMQKARLTRFPSLESARPATITVGGKLLNAITIEHFILRLPYHLTHTCPKPGNRDDMKPRSTFGLEWSEPLVTFALSCGSWSSPAVRVYTASQVETQLEAAKRDYLQATVGISSANKMIIPKLLDWYLFDFAKDFEGLLDWICLQLPYDLRNATLECLERREREPLSQIVEIIPYSFNFRYLIQR